MVGHRVWIMTFILLSVLGCTGPRTTAVPASNPQERTPVLGRLPATFSGDFPCADCPGIRYQLTLHPDHAFFLSLTYLERNSRFDSIGSWIVSPDGQRLVLYDESVSPDQFRIIDPNNLRKLGIDGHDIATGLNYTLTRANDVESPESHLALRGMYRYVADAGSFSECLTGRRWPVMQQADNASLEQTYVKFRKQPNDELLATVEGRVVTKSGADGATPHPMLIVDRFLGLWPGETCGARLATSTLENTYWKLTRLAGMPVIVPEQQREPAMVLHQEQHRLAGSGGCNRLMGEYRLDRRLVSFSQVAGTKMACRAGMEQEEHFIEALGRTAAWTVIGEHLELFDAEGKQLARFEARALR
ncbi:hypothetical protein W02_00760 [Nitrospira sp. KM1]|uniref:META domain-containing protein n=1 Tax=Nitrospira sp. KM1 TaxID=1936990 RepID=UPI0013A7A717|nr:META domain-containing protein [Nitrospira sp. KM1]BCA52936.1 hypothetical protein W02_00760 [Nitrospira sp. KM1]